MNPWLRLKKATSAFIFALIPVCYGLSPEAQAVSPPPDGAYPNFTTAEGQNALKDLTTGAGNTALGAFSMFSTTTASFNTAVGAGALDLNTGDQNTAVGVAALLLNTGINNTGVGVDALGLNSTGSTNTATGAFTLYNNTTGANNTANGFQALFFNTVGNGNTANGFQALFSNTTGLGNTAIGRVALSNNTSGSENIGLGDDAGSNVATASNVICIGAGTSGADVSGTCFIGNIRGTTTQNNDAIPVLIDSAGQLGTASSSRRYKTDIKPMDNSSESILALKPVSFRYKIHKDTTPQFGLIAEEVAEANPDLVIYDADGKPYTVRYDAVNAMLLNEFLKEHRRVEKLEAMVAQQRKDFEAAVAQLTTQVQKVSAQLEANKPAPQVVNNP
jgi:hypothetical protein